MSGIGILTKGWVCGKNYIVLNDPIKLNLKKKEVKNAILKKKEVKKLNLKRR